MVKASRHRILMTRRHAVVGAIAVGLASHVASADVPAASMVGGTPTAGASEFEDRLDAAFAEIGQSGVSAIVAVAHRDASLVIREFGAARDDDIRARSTQIDIGSITKSVTGVMVLKLVEQGKLRLDETLAEIFADVPADKADITVHQLLTHAAGFIDAVGDDAEQLTRDDFVRRAFDTALVDVPGERYHYSNVGFAILAAIIEERSGKSYDQYLQEDVLAGTGLENTGYLSVYDDERSLQAAPAPEVPEGVGQPIIEASWGGHEPSWNLIGNGGMISTVEEFIRFRQLVTAGHIIPPNLVEQSQTPHIPEDDAGTSYYGYGLVVENDPAVGRIYWHDGGNDVFSAEWRDFADQGDVVFTAAADSAAGDAFFVMEVLQQHLYGAAASD